MLTRVDKVPLISRGDAREPDANRWATLARLLVLAISIGVALGGCATRTVKEAKYVYQAPPQYDGPISVAYDSQTMFHYFLRMRGTQVSRIDVTPVVFDSSASATARAYVPDQNRLQASTKICVRSGLEGRSSNHPVITQDVPISFSSRGTPGTLINYTMEKNGQLYKGVLACLASKDFWLMINFQESVDALPSDIPAVVKTIKNTTFRVAQQTHAARRER